MTKTSIFHITTREAWESQRPSGRYRAPSLDTEGFVHCSDAPQVNATWENIFAHAPDLIVLEIDPHELTSELRYEAGVPDAGEDFPHVYGPIDANAVRGVHPLPLPLPVPPRS